MAHPSSSRMERLLADLSKAVDLGGSLNDILLSIKHFKPSHDDAKLDLRTAYTYFYKICRVSPCLDDALMAVLPVLAKDLSSELSLEEAYQALNVPDSISVDVKGWINLCLLRSLSNHRSFTEDLLKDVRSWGLFDPCSLQIASTKSALFRGRLSESLGKLAYNCSESFELDEAFTSWMLEGLYSNDDFVLQKTKELIVAVLIKFTPPSLFEQILDLHSKMKVKYQIISLLFDTCKKLERKGFKPKSWDISLWFLWEAKREASVDRGIAPAICDCLTAILGSDFITVDDDLGYPLNRKDILEYIMCPRDGARPLLAKYLLPRVVVAQPLLVKELIFEYQARWQEPYSLETYIILLLTLFNEFGGLPEGSSLDMLTMAAAINSSNDEIRLGAFGCLCRAFGPSKSIDRDCLLLIEKFLCHLRLDSTANLRQKALVSLQALFSSLIARAYTLFRLSAKDPEAFKDEQTLLTSWMARLFNEAIDCLHQQFRLKYGCVDLALRILLEWSKAIGNRLKSKSHRPTTPFDDQVDSWISEINERTVLARRDLFSSTILDNSFESNRQMAFTLCECFSIISPESKESLKNEALKRLKSPKEALSDGAALILILVELSAGAEHVPLLREQLSAAKLNISLAAAENNLNGTLCLLAQMAGKGLLSHDLFEEISDLAIVIGCMVSEFASLSSPEGSDFSSEEERENSAIKTNQLVLTFCWRAIKESTLIEELSFAKQITDHLIGLLFSLRHPGAFCAVEDPLVRVCQALFSSSLPDARAYPLEVLREAVEVCLLKPEIEMTRRSAGLPICISAILTAAVLTGVNKKVQKHHIDTESLIAVPAETMLRLVSQVDLSLESDPSLVTAVHALNIMRALFRNANLDSLTTPYVTRSFQVCFRSFGSASWSVRNGAMMLLGALVRRAFGSASIESTEEFSQLDVRQLAAKFPDLPALIEAQIELNLDSNLYPILSVLQRLRFSAGAIASYPSLFEKTYDFLTLTCLSDARAKVRRMTVRLLVKPIVRACPEIVWDRLMAFISNLRSCRQTNVLSSKLAIIVGLLDDVGIEDTIRPQEDLFLALCKATTLPAAIRWPALLIWHHLAKETKKNIEFEQLDSFVQPYQYELCHEIISKSENKSYDLDSISWPNLKYRLLSSCPIDSNELGKNFRSLKISEKSLEPRSGVQTRIEHYGWKLASFQSSPKSVEAILNVVFLHSKNPDFVKACFEALVKIESFGAVLQLAHKYLAPENGFSDVLRLAVIESFPEKWPYFDFDLFLALRLGLTDDDEDVRLCALAKARSAFFSVEDLSLPRTLELLHQQAHSSFKKRYLTWRKSLTEGFSSPTDSNVLFAAEPLNLFVFPSWERAIIKP